MLKNYVSKINKSLTLFAFFLLAGCAGHKNFIALPEELNDQVGSTDLMVQRVEKELGAEIESSNLRQTIKTEGNIGGAIGLIGFLVDAGVEAHRKSVITNALKDVQHVFNTLNIQEKINNTLAKAMKKHKWIHLQNTFTVEEMNSFDLEKRLLSSNKDVTALAKVKLGFNSALDSFTAQLEVTFYPTGGSVKGIVKPEDITDKPIMRFKTFASETLDNASEEVEENGKVWSENNAKKFRDGLDNVLKTLSVRMDQFLSSPCSIAAD